MRELDLKTWPRRAVYELFSGCDWPFYEVSFPLDVTRLRAYTKKESPSRGRCIRLWSGFPSKNPIF